MLFEDEVFEYLSGLNGNFAEIWLLVKKEIDNNDPGTVERELAQLLVNFMKWYYRHGKNTCVVVE